MRTSSDTQFSTTPLGEQVIFDVNRHAFDKVDSASIYRNLFRETLEADKATDKPFLYVVLGTDSGLLAEWFFRQPLHPHTRLLFIELPEVIEAVRPRLEGQFDEERFRLCAIDDWKALIKPWNVAGHIYTDSFRELHSIALSDGNLDSYQDVRERFRSEWNEYHYRLRAGSENNIYVERQIENAPDNLWPVQLLKGSLPALPAVILGGGPSLDGILPWIEAHRDQLLVIAVSRISRQLLARNLIPDIVVSIDPQEISFDISKELLRFPDSTLFVNAFHVEPHLLGQWPNTALYCGDQFPWQQDKGEKNLSVHGPTVTNTAFSLALYLGCPRIVLAGVDLCFTQEGHTHAAGSNERNTAPTLSSPNRVETNAGEMSDSDPAFMLAIDFFGEQAAVGIQDGRDIINPVLTAAKIPNVRYAPLEEIELPPQDTPAPEQLEKLRPRPDEAQRRKALDSTRKELARAHNGFRNILKLTEEALDCNARQFDDPKHVRRMDKIESELDGKHKEFSRSVKLFATGKFLSLSRPSQGENWTDDELLRWGDSYYRIYSDATQALMDLIEQAQEKLESRLREQDERPDFAALAEYWKSSNTPGRAAIWLKRHPEHGLDDETRGTLDTLCNEYEHLLEEKDTRHTKHKKESARIDLILSIDKLQVLFRSKDTVELQRMAQQLAGINTPSAVDGSILALAYVAELEGRQDDAYQLYSRIVDNSADSMDMDDRPEGSQILVAALKQMSSIALGQNNVEEALQILDVLSALSPIFTPQYAELLGLVGRLEEAATLYSQYLDSHPDDLQTMLKMGKLFQDGGVADAARWAYDYVLEKDPDNLTAKQLLASLAE